MSIRSISKAAFLTGLLVTGGADATADSQQTASIQPQPNTATQQYVVSPGFKQGSLEQRFTDFEPHKSLWDAGKVFAKRAKDAAKAGNRVPVKMYMGAPPLASFVPGYKGGGAFDIEEASNYVKYIAQNGYPPQKEKNIIIPRALVGVFIPPGLTADEWRSRLDEVKRIATESVAKYAESHGASVWEVFPIVAGAKDTIYSEFLGGEAQLFRKDVKGTLHGAYIVSVANRIYYGTEKTPEQILPNSPADLRRVFETIFEKDHHILTREELVEANCKRDNICPSPSGVKNKVAAGGRNASDTTSSGDSGKASAGNAALDMSL